MQRPTTSLTVLTLAAACLLGACGFQLRGVGDNTLVLPEAWKSMTLVTGNPNSEFSREIKARFAANDVQWTEGADANYRLVLGAERCRQRNLSLNSEARAAEFELTMSTSFTVLDARGRVAMQETTASVIKQMENDPRNVVGKSEEIRLLQQEMRVELVRQILRRVSFFAAGSGAAGAEAGASRSG